MTDACQVCGLERAAVRTQLRFQGEFVAVAACVDRAACRPRVEAAGGAMGLRTAYRWRRDFDRIETVAVGNHRADFIIRRRGLPPVRVSEWVPALPVPRSRA